MRTTRRELAFLAAGVLTAGAGLLIPSQGVAAPSADLWEFWAAHDESAADKVDHSIYQAFLDRYLRPHEGKITLLDYGAAPRRYLRTHEGKVNLLDYGAVTKADKAKLAAYLEALANLPIRSYRRDEQLAYWINLYNALTISVVLDHFPVDSIKDIDISPGLFSQGPWGKALITIEGQDLSLDDIEHRILRPIWRDARIHYAANCAALSCPSLQSEVFLAGKLDQQLEKAARAYVNDQRGVSFDDDGELVLSSIYDWYGVDFGRNEQEVIAHIAGYAEAPLREKLAKLKSVSGYRYDWTLNAARPADD